MSRALLNEARMQRDLPPRWIMELLSALAGGKDAKRGGGGHGQRGDVISGPS